MARRSTPHGSTVVDHAGSVRVFAAAAGVFFLLFGILGFVPGVTTNIDGLQFAGNAGETRLLGLFHVSVLVNVLHLLFGVIGLLVARSGWAAVAYLFFGGAIFLLLWLYGAFTYPPVNAQLVPVQAADNWLHLALGLVLGGAGVYGRTRLPITDRVDEGLSD